jgi:predicted alpha/beta hydrolase family esterase
MPLKSHENREKPAGLRPRRAFIFHGYLGYPEEAWQPWLKRELEKRGFAVALPAMPHPDRPVMAEWIRFIEDLIGEPDEETVLVGHSLGVQAVLRYLEKLGRAGKSVGRTVLIAGMFPFGMSEEAADQRTGGDPTLRPWLTTSVDPEPVRRAMGTCTVILSDTDPIIPVEQAKASFQTSLDAMVIVEHGKGHFNEDDHITELPIALDQALGQP